ncbi:hypothetical protein A2U01_0100371, partial [Trifolium medium]|nr:hypothetical protein [Trifolium medium]
NLSKDYAGNTVDNPKKEVCKAIRERTEKESWKNNCECCKKEVGNITEDGPELTYPPK